MGEPHAALGGIELATVASIDRLTAGPVRVVKVRRVDPEPVIRSVLIAEESDPRIRMVACKRCQKCRGGRVMYRDWLGAGSEFVALSCDRGPWHGLVSRMQVAEVTVTAPAYGTSCL